MMVRQLKNVISVVYSGLRFFVKKVICGSGFQCGYIERFSPNVVVELNKGGKMVFGKRVRVHSGSKIKVRKNAKLVIEDDVHINYNCMIICHDAIKIGKGTEFGPSVFLYDHDHDYKAGLKNGEYICEPITIGINCWIGANTVILRGTTIGDNTVIGAGSIIKGNYPPNSVVIQKRQTEIRGGG